MSILFVRTYSNGIISWYAIFTMIGIFRSSGSKYFATSFSFPGIVIIPDRLILALLGFDNNTNLYSNFMPESLFSISSIDTSILYFSNKTPAFILLTAMDAISIFGPVIVMLAV